MDQRLYNGVLEWTTELVKIKDWDLNGIEQQINGSGKL